MNWKRGATLLALVAAMSVVAAGCGGDDDSTDTTGDAAATTAGPARRHRRAGATTTAGDTGTTTGAAGEWQIGDAWDAGAPPEWADILAAGQEEGVVVVGGFPFLEEPMEEAFERDTGIRLEYVGGDGADISARFAQEAQSGNMTMDSDPRRWRRARDHLPRRSPRQCQRPTDPAWSAGRRAVAGR